MDVGLYKAKQLATLTDIRHKISIRGQSSITKSATWINNSLTANLVICLV